MVVMKGIDWCGRVWNGSVGEKIKILMIGGWGILWDIESEVLFLS